MSAPRKLSRDGKSVRTPVRAAKRNATPGPAQPESPSRRPRQGQRRTTDPAVNRGRNNETRANSFSTTKSFSSDRSYEGDRINPARFRRMAPVPKHTRRRLLLAVEPFGCAPREMLNGFIEQAETKPPRDGMIRSKAQGVTKDFCVRFSRDLVGRLRGSAAALRRLATRNSCWLYVRSTLLLRGSRRTNTWTKYLMCRICSTQRLHLSRFILALEHFEPEFTRRQPCLAQQPRVTLVPNRTVPENTALRISRQRLHRSDNYFGKMPLLPDPFISNLAAKLTSDCIMESSTLTQLVEFV